MPLEPHISCQTKCRYQVGYAVLYYTLSFCVCLRVHACVHVCVLSCMHVCMRSFVCVRAYACVYVCGMVGGGGHQCVLYWLVHVAPRVPWEEQTLGYRWSPCSLWWAVVQGWLGMLCRGDGIVVWRPEVKVCGRVVCL